MNISQVIERYREAASRVTQSSWSHRQIAKRMNELRKEGLPVETVTVHKNGKRWTIYLIQAGGYESA
jgi:translation elongation factor EF-1alpha